MERRSFAATCLAVLLFCVIFLSLLFNPFISFADYTGVVTASSLNMRKKASKDSDIIKVLREGDQVTITDSTGNWYKVKVGKNVGYVSKSYISKNGSNSTSSSKATSSSSISTLRKGATGSAVKDLQNKLKKLGYYDGSIDGDFGNGTETAVKKFQKAKGLGADGVAGAKTLSALGLNGSSDSDSYTTQRLDWFKNGSKTIPKGAVFEVKDIKTGKIFTVRRWSGSNHIDAEPKTASDTKILKSIYGSWSWRRRAVLVKYNGHVYAASINGMPHGTQTISDNNFDGHFCIHFYKSKTHGTKKVDEEHQNCVAKAMNYSW